MTFCSFAPQFVRCSWRGEKVIFAVPLGPVIDLFSILWLDIFGRAIVLCGALGGMGRKWRACLQYPARKDCRAWINHGFSKNRRQRPLRTNLVVYKVFTSVHWGMIGFLSIRQKCLGTTECGDGARKVKLKILLPVPPFSMGQARVDCLIVLR